MTTMSKTIEDIKKEVVGIVVDQLGVDAADVSAEKSFTGDLGADSLDLVELIMGFEEHFGCEIPDSDAEGLKTVGDVFAYIERRMPEFKK